MTKSSLTGIDPAKWMRPLKICVILFTLAMTVLITMLFIVARIPTVRDIMLCRSNMVQIYSAIGRYRDQDGRYPPSLEALRKDYLSNASVLRCPLETGSGVHSSYTYTMPKENSIGSTAILQCSRHHLRSDWPASRLLLYKDGTVKIENPSLTTRHSEK